MARQNRRCQEIEPSSAYVSSSRGTATNPVFYVGCETANGYQNVFFSASDVNRGDVTTRNISRGRALSLCEAYAKANATIPDTVDFSQLLDVNFTQLANGRSRLVSSFSAENALGTERDFDVTCLFDSDSLIEGTIN